MANHDLQQFSDLFTSLENTVIDLDKREADLKRSCKTLEARQSFLQSDIKQLESKRQEAAEMYVEAGEKAKAEQQEADALLADTKLLTTAEQKNRKIQESNFADRKKELQAELTNISQEIRSRQQVISDLQQAKADLNEELQELSQTIMFKKAELNQLDIDLGDKKITNNQEIDNLNIDKKKVENDVRKLKVVRDDINEDIEVAKDTLKEVTAAIAQETDKHKKYVEYETESKKKLKAHESALIRREQTIKNSERRLQSGRILDVG